MSSTQIELTCCSEPIDIATPEGIADALVNKHLEWAGGYPGMWLRFDRYWVLMERCEEKHDSITVFSDEQMEEWAQRIRTECEQDSEAIKEWLDVLYYTSPEPIAHA